MPTWVTEENDLDPEEVEEVTAQLIEQFLCQCYPDEVPWPLCPPSPDHPLQFGLHDTRRFCSFGHDVSIPLGELQHAASARRA